MKLIRYDLILDYMVKCELWPLEDSSRCTVFDFKRNLLVSLKYLFSSGCIDCYQYNREKSTLEKVCKYYVEHFDELVKKD